MRLNVPREWLASLVGAERGAEGRSQRDETCRKGGTIELDLPESICDCELEGLHLLWIQVQADYERRLLLCVVVFVSIRSVFEHGLVVTLLLEDGRLELKLGEVDEASLVLPDPTHSFAEKLLGGFNPVEERGKA